MDRLVVLLSSKRLNGRDLTGLARKWKDSRAMIVACDPKALIMARAIIDGPIAASSLLSASDCNRADERAYRDSRLAQASPIREPRTGQPLGFLMSRTILFRLLTLEKSVAVAQRLIQEATRFELVGNPEAVPGHPYPPEFEDLHEIVSTWSSEMGIPCGRTFDEGAAPQRSRSDSRALPRIALSLAERLFHRRTRRVLTVGLYGDLRTRLRALLPRCSVLPFVSGGSPSEAEVEEARQLCERWIAGVRRPTDNELPDRIDEFRRQRVEQAMRYELPEVLHVAKEMQATVGRYRPHAVVFMEDVSPPGRALCSLARQSGAWTLLVQHGLVGEDLGGTSSMPSVAHLNFAWGPHSAAWNYQHGAPPESQTVGGNPMLDHYSARRETAALDRVGASSQVVYASQPFVGVSSQESDFDRLRLLSVLIQFHAEGTPIIIRPHPRDELDDLKTLVREVGLQKAEWDWSLQISLDRPAVFVTKSSTVALEAMLCGKPVILAVLSGRGDRTGLSSYGGVPVASTVQELASAIRSCLSDPSFRRGLETGRETTLAMHLDGLDGRAVERLAASIRAHVPA